jgi:mannosidase alpha-like ER degradation enhancer 2
MNSGKLLRREFGALDAFFPAVLALSGDLHRAKKLQISALKMWQLYGIEPEGINYDSMTVVYDGYALRPEIIESTYYLYHFTHDDRYLQMGIKFFQDVKRYCRTENGYAPLSSVITKEKRDIMHSFFLAETLKYFYLLFTSDPPLDFDKIVFNTEAHPLKRTK